MVPIYVNNSAQRSVKRMRQSDFNYNTYLDMHEEKLEIRIVLPEHKIHTP